MASVMSVKTVLHLREKKTCFPLRFERTCLSALIPMKGMMSVVGQ